MSANEKKALESAAAAAEEEEELVDPLAAMRAKCAEEHCPALKTKFDECEARVNSRSNTKESCQEELLDLMHCVDHCAMPKLFKTIK